MLSWRCHGGGETVFVQLSWIGIIFSGGGGGQNNVLIIGPTKALYLITIIFAMQILEPWIRIMAIISIAISVFVVKSWLLVIANYENMMVTREVLEQEQWELHLSWSPSWLQEVQSWGRLLEKPVCFLMV